MGVLVPVLTCCVDVGESFGPPRFQFASEWGLWAPPHRGSSKIKDTDIPHC